MQAVPQNSDALPSSATRACGGRCGAADAQAREHVADPGMRSRTSCDATCSTSSAVRAKRAGDFQPQPQAVSPDLETIQEKYWPENAPRPAAERRRVGQHP